MRYEFPIQKLFALRRIERDLSVPQIAEKLGVSRAYLYAVLSYKSPCPRAFAYHLAEIIGEPKEVIAMALGHLPEGLKDVMRHEPEKALSIIQRLVDKSSYGKRSKNKRNHS
jgi:transcriptional regulator with XRE-family HTH domain